jgi:hypothetical protein
MRKYVWWGLAIIAGYVVVRVVPDVARYIKIRSM